MASGDANSAAPSPLRARVGQNIRIARSEAGLKQAELATRIGMNDGGQSVSNWERGVYAPSEDNLVALAAALGRDIGWFYADHDEERVAA